MNKLRFFISFELFIGLLNTGPSFSTKFTPNPSASGIVNISENKIAASRSKAFIGWSASSQQTSGFVFWGINFWMYFFFYFNQRQTQTLD